MARTTRPLTNTEIKQARAKPKEYNLADGGGLALRVKPTGSKYWIFNYSRPYTKQRANISFGSYPDLSLADARAEREIARKLLAKSLDPRDERVSETCRRKAELENTLKAIAEQWFAIKKHELTPEYADDLWSSLDNHIFPKLGKLPLQKIQAPQVIATLKPLANAGRHESVKRICQRLNQIMVFGLNTGVIPSNPLTGVNQAFKTPTKKHLPTIKPEELPKFVKAIEQASITFTTLQLIKWQLHTMSRPSEAAGTRWDEIDLFTNLWTIPAERMKKSRIHTVPLTDQCIEILQEMKPLSGHREFVFPADRNPRKSIGVETANMALKRMGYKGKLVAHGMRALASTTLNEEGFDSDLIEAALAHVDKNTVRNAYNHAEYLERRWVMMSWWSSHIEDPKSEVDSNLISLHSSKTVPSQISSFN